MLRFFTAHPASVGESYWAHAGRAFGFAALLFGAALACLAHALIPALFERTASRTIARLYGEMIAHRDRRAVPADAASRPDGAR